MKKLILSVIALGFSAVSFAQVTSITTIDVSLQTIGSMNNVFVSAGVTSLNLSGWGNVTGGAGGLNKIVSISTDSLDSNCRQLLTSFASHVILHRKLTPTVGVPLLKITGSVSAGSTRSDNTSNNSITFTLKPLSRLGCEVSYGSFNCATGICQPN